MLAATGIAILAIVLLAAGLPGLNLDAPPAPFPFRLRMPSFLLDPPPVSASPSLFNGRLLRTLSILLLALLPIIIILAILSPEFRNRLLRQIILIISIFIVLQVVSVRLRQWIWGGTAELGEVGDWGELPSLEPPEELLASPPSWLIFAISGLLALAVTALLAWLIIWWWRRAHPPIAALEELAQEARKAIAALRDGGELRNAILSCYRRMVRILHEKQGIERQPAMTPREFERRLAQTGLPQPDIQRLTRLFERVRYGDKPPSPTEEQEAIAALQAIIQAAEKPL